MLKILNFVFKIKKIKNLILYFGNCKKKVNITSKYFENSKKIFFISISFTYTHSYYRTVLQHV